MSAGCVSTSGPVLLGDTALHIHEGLQQNNVRNLAIKLKALDHIDFLFHSHCLHPFTSRNKNSITSYFSIHQCSHAVANFVV